MAIKPDPDPGALAPDHPDRRWAMALAAVFKVPIDRVRHRRTELGLGRS